MPKRYAPRVDAQLINLGTVEYTEALALQRSIAESVGKGESPDTVLLLEHPPTITLGRRTEPGEVHVVVPFGRTVQPWSLSSLVAVASE